MQTNPLPIQVSTPSPAPQRANAAPQSDNAQFSQALSREMAQRQDSPAPAAARPQAAPAQAKPASAKANEAKPADGKSADAKAIEAKTPVAKTDDAKAASASTDAASDDARDAADDAAITPVAELIAMVASFNQAPAASAPATDPVAAEVAVAAASGATDKQLKADLEAALAKTPAQPGAVEATGAAGKDAAAIEGAAHFSVTELAGAAAKAARPEAGEPAPAHAAAHTRDLPSAGAPKADLADAPAHARADPAAAPLKAEQAPRVRDADVAVLKEQASAAPVSAPVQQAALTLAQAVHGAPATDRIAARVGTPGWDQQVGQKIIWMVAGKDQSATLTLNPPDMGPMQVVLNVHNDQASVTFSAAQPEVRQALENAMPKLREMMQESGIALGNATVDAGTPDQRQAQQNELARSQRAGGRAGSDGAVETPVVAPRAARPGGGAGLVDTFA